MADELEGGLDRRAMAQNAVVRQAPQSAEGLDAEYPHDVMTWIDNNFHQPCDLGRAGLPEDRPHHTYPASRRNGYVTGATDNVDGGSDFV